MKQQIMNLPEGRTIADLARAIETVMMTREGLTTQLLTTANGDYVIQGRSANANASQWVGMDKNLTIHLSAVGERGVLYQAGADFEQLGDESPTVSRRKDRAKVKSLTLEMYEKAILYYSKAQESGYQGAADRIAAVKEKMATLEQ